MGDSEPTVRQKGIKDGKCTQVISIALESKLHRFETHEEDPSSPWSPSRWLQGFPTLDISFSYSLCSCEN
ncbi:unnamed protein product [Bursaphelenchus xylophilus]|uniref:(pine wood nematode) hypothetical protein n=1 Tax=Bursaphelenchus xylophilus TaxID=6326 RepID=A0A1I7SEP5_BURXY|nr:unnamed protein product [Bursaphelenchus xylophilus]CAG9092843.1 unnamed protein product [Bursaphelenchus xylophilus]